MLAGVPGIPAELPGLPRDVIAHLFYDVKGRFVEIAGVSTPGSIPAPPFTHTIGASTLSDSSRR
jgi:hypothetical protein